MCIFQKVIKKKGQPFQMQVAHTDKFACAILPKN